MAVNPDSLEVKGMGILWEKHLEDAMFQKGKIDGMDGFTVHYVHNPTFDTWNTSLNTTTNMSTENQNEQVKENQSATDTNVEYVAGVNAESKDGTAPTSEEVQEKAKEALSSKEVATKFALDTKDTPAADDYHTTGELYGCRHALMIALCNSHPQVAWKTRVHSDGTPSYEGYFLLGFRKNHGAQISFHLPEQLWEFSRVPELAQAPEFDGHNTQDVIERLLLMGI